MEDKTFCESEPERQVVSRMLQANALFHLAMVSFSSPLITLVLQLMTDRKADKLMALKNEFSGDFSIIDDTVREIYRLEFL